MLRVALVTVTALLTLPAAAQANWELAADGHPRITVPETIEGGELRVCPPGGGACTTVDGSVHEPGETAPGTTFELWASGPPGSEPTLVERSPAWHGRVTNTAPPAIDGRRFMTGDARPVAGAWTGGWGDDISALGLFACTDPAGADCVALPAVHGCPYPCLTTPATFAVAVSGGGAAALPPSLPGRVLIATERRLPRDQRGWPKPVPALWTPHDSFALEPASAVRARSVPVGPLGLPSVQVIVERVPQRSSVTLRKRALRSKGRLSLGRIECLHRCRVSVKVSGGGRKARTTTFVVQGKKAIKTPVRHGKLNVRVHVDGKLLANGRVRAR